MSARAHADGARTSSLSWLRMPNADSCIATQALARSVEDRLGRHVFVSAAEADVSVEGRIEKRKAGWHAVITIRDAKGALLGTRELDRADASCESMNEGLALVIAVMIDPDAAMGKPPPPPPAPSAEPPLPPPAATPPPPPPPAPEPPKPKQKDPLRVQGEVGAVFNDGIAPVFDPGVQVAGMLWPPGLPVAARGYASLYLPTDATQNGAKGSFDLVLLGSALCPTARSTIGVAMLCTGGELGVIRSHSETDGRGIDEKTMLLINLVGQARFTVPLIAPVALTGGVAGFIPVLRPTFLYTSTAGSRENLHKVSLGGLSTDIGIAFFFP